MFEKLSRYLAKPALYAPGTNKLWDDEHISKGMLEAHLSPDWDAATRNHAFVDASVSWVAQIAPPSRQGALLDLGCGPGLYAERFGKAGYLVTGIDFSLRSIEYAKEQARQNKSDIEYHYQNYLTMEYREQFDVITLIYCDYAVLPVSERHALLGKVHQALRPGGKFIFDVFTPRMRRAEKHAWNHNAQGGFFSAKPHLCLESVYQYDDADQTELRQSIIVTQDTVDCYNIWDHFFTREALLSEISAAGFSASELYGDVAGKAFTETGDTICVVLRK